MVLPILVKKAFKAQTTYRMNAVIKMASGLLMLFVQISVWNALYSQGHRSESTLSETLTYLLLTTQWMPLLRFYPGIRIGETVYTGELGVDMLRPVNLVKLHMGRELGEVLFTGLSLTLPTTVLVLFFVEILPPISVWHFAAFLLTALLGAVLFLLFDLIIGYMAFWLTANWFMSWFESAILLLFGGGVVPIWFYPQSLAQLTALLPFQYIHYVPINYYLGRWPIESLGQTILIQLGWIGVLFLLERLIWRAAQKKITVQGG